MLKNCYVNFVMPSQSLFVNEATLALLLYLLVRGLARGGGKGSSAPLTQFSGEGNAPQNFTLPKKIWNWPIL